MNCKITLFLVILFAIYFIDQGEADEFEDTIKKIKSKEEMAQALKAINQELDQAIRVLENALKDPQYAPHKAKLSNAVKHLKKLKNGKKQLENDLNANKISLEECKKKSIQLHNDCLKDLQALSSK